MPLERLSDLQTGVIFGSFSKYFWMTGWRLGWALMPEDLRRPVDALGGNFAICPPVLGQHAALAAFTPASYAEPDGPSPAPPPPAD